VVWLVLV